ncbi:MAG: acyl-CoA thioesterase II [Pseudomonadales bacterium]
MSEASSKITEFMRLERIEEDIFRGESRDLGTPQVYGGQVLGQALHAARQTVEGREAHSVHAYFLRRGDFEAPIVYQVDRSRDGGSFSARRVVAIQHGKPIFTLSASFQASEPGLDYYVPADMPATPEELTALGLLTPDEGRHTIRILASDFDVFKVKLRDGEAPPANHSRRWWIKVHHRLPDTIDLHHTILAYVSDFGLLYAALAHHAENDAARKKLMQNIQLASIDHTIWFHRPFRVDDWLLYDCRAVSNSGARACAQGSFYTSDGVLVATTFQEGLARPHDS